MARGGMYNHAPWLVDHNDIAVFKKDFQRNILCGQSGFLCLRQRRFQQIAFFAAGVFPCGLSVHQNVSLFDQALHRVARKSGMQSEESVDTLSALLCTH